MSPLAKHGLVEHGRGASRCSKPLVALGAIAVVFAAGYVTPRQEAFRVGSLDRDLAITLLSDPAGPEHQRKGAAAWLFINDREHASAMRRILDDETTPPGLKHFLTTLVTRYGHLGELDLPEDCPCADEIRKAMGKH